jgi:peptide/nickel transport system permease protein
MLPTTTIIALNLGFVVSGAITVETVFSIPGLGLLTTEAIQVPDFWVLQGCFLLASAGVILANLAANLVYGWLDPRVRT